ncbi:MAG: methyltransferase domain-containing protein [Pseudomonadota bacterium]
MHLDVVDLNAFYYKSHLGALAQRRLQSALRRRWTNVSGLSFGGYGFAAPFLRPFRSEASRTIAMMPAAQGVISWPREGPNASTLIEPYDWPLQTGFLDRLLVAHGLETAEQPHRLLEECWRVLAPEGRLMIIAPNRSGLWARRDGNPFGFGRPYSFDQLDAQLAEHGFGIESHGGALYFPPSQKRWWLNSGNLFERLGQRFDLQRLAGVLIVEAVKRVAAPRSGLKERATAPLEVLGGIIRPQPRPEPAGRGG